MVRPGCDDSRQVPVAEVRPDSWVRRAPEPPKDDTVTLTKSQFKQILEVIGQVNVVNGNDKIYNCQEIQEFQPSKNPSENGINNPDVSKDILNKESSENILHSTVENSNKLNVPCPLDVLISCPTSIAWSAPQTEFSPSKQLSPLSKVEQKRLQWQKERAEMIDWNPWGKPGAGAPPKKTQIVAPITPHNNQLLMVQTSGAIPYTTSMPTAISSCIPSPSHARMLTANLEQHNFLANKNFSNYTCVAQPIKPVPPVFKSSIAFGNADNESISTDFFKRQQWLHDLEYQREEQRRIHEQMHIAQVPDSAWGNNCKDEVESISVSMDGSILPGATDYHKRTYIRGQGFQLDPVSAALAEERRVKAQEYQQAIRLQMEEKQSRLQAERERKKREEEAEERRLQAERARIQAEYEEEQLRIKQKAEMEEKKQQALISAVQQAQAQAEIEKKSRKIQKLIPLQSENSEALSLHSKKNDEGGSICSLSSNMETKLNITDSQQSLANINRDSESVSESKCKNEFESKKDLGIQTTPVSDIEHCSTYVVDRVLTPSIFRVRAKTSGHGREFGTQTDIHYGKYTTEDAESTESNTSSFHNPIGKRIVRVQHNKPYKAQRRAQCNENMHPSERPKWGVNQPSKSYVRMTERDPHFTKRKRMQEIRKQHWARELAAQKANQSSRRLMVASYPSLRAQKAASSSDCTIGYSSSEFETRSCHHFRSNSTPRCQQPSGFRSDCGSAETIAYFNYNPSAHRSLITKSVLHHRDSQSSDNLPSIIGGSEPSPSHRIHNLSRKGGNLPAMRRKWHSQEAFYPANNFHSFSPPHVPGVHPRILGESYHYELPPPHVPQRRKWSDQESFDLESVVRSRVAEGSRASSAESSGKSRTASASSAASSRAKSASNQNPLVCPEVVMGRPTPRQDRILQNLSSLRQGLLKKQRELESLIRRPPPYLS